MLYTNTSWKQKNNNYSVDSMYIKTIATYVEVMIQVIHNKPQTKVETNEDLFTKKSIFLFSK